MEQGQIINGLTSKMWIERYLLAGEFKFVAPATADMMKNKLPKGSFVSHVGSTEIMRVENHEITDERGREPQLIISGRGFETFFENRIVGSNKTYPTSGESFEYVLAADTTWNQAVTLIKKHILASELLDDGDSLPYVEVLTDVVGSGVIVSRPLKRGDLYTRLMEHLTIENLGIKVIRPGPWSPLSAGSPNVAVQVHIGVNRSDQIIFSNDTEEIERAEYLWSIKKLKNTALVSGRWVETLVTTAETGYDRLMMPVDASDIDNQYSVAPTGTDLIDVVDAMQQRGISALSAQNEVAITKVEVSKDANKATYRRDFDVGDIITVNGDYNESSSMRISEYVEIEDENGESGHPTLSVL